MSIAVIESAFRAKLAEIVATVAPWPIRWPNEMWIAGVGNVIGLSSDNSPLGADGRPAPFVEAQTIFGPDTGDIAPAGNRHSETIGLFRVYLSVQKGTGTADINMMADAIHDSLKRKTIWYAPPLRLTVMDPKIDDNVAIPAAQAGTKMDGTVPMPTKGDRFVRQISAVWRWDYFS
jgi:hypothetical protein